jgi:AMIN domain
MKFFSRISPGFGIAFVATFAASVLGFGQATPQPVSFSKARPKVHIDSAILLKVRVVPDKNGPAVEILSTRPLAPDVQKLDGPPRLVIDLPNTNNSLQQKKVDFQLGAISSDPVRGVRIDQFQNSPPVTRVVIDLLKSSEYSWDLAGNLLTVRLHSADPVAAKPETVASLTPDPQPVMVPVSTGGSGIAVSLDRFSAGSTVTAGSNTQILSLGRGGEVRVCPGTTLSVTNSSNGQDLMFGMSTGAFEAHYMLQSSADSVLTPDFRIVLAGPGEFHYAISADARGNTCMRTLPGNAASAVVSELIGDDKYEVKPGEQVVFRSGRLNAMDTTTTSDCGCPTPPIPEMRASAETPQMKESPESVHLSQAGDRSPMVGSETAPLPPPTPKDTRIQIEAPLVFRASDLPPAHSEPKAAIQVSARNNSMTSTSMATPATVFPNPQASVTKPHRGFFGKVKGFFSSIFH